MKKVFYFKKRNGFEILKAELDELIALNDHANIQISSLLSSGGGEWSWLNDYLATLYCKNFHNISSRFKKATFLFNFLK